METEKQDTGKGEGFFQNLKPVRIPFEEGVLETLRAGDLVSAVVPGIRPVPFGHLGDGNLHYNLSQPGTMPAEQFLSYWAQLNEVVHTLAHELGGSFSAEHGIGALKAAELERLAAPAKLALMRAIKSSLDPNNIMNPGKVLKTQQD